MKIISCIEENIPMEPGDNVYISQFKSSEKVGAKWFGGQTLTDIRKKKALISDQTWDYLIFSLSIAAVDRLVLREEAADCWTRKLNVEIHLGNPSVWEEQKFAIERMLRVLTGDFWNLSFKEGGFNKPIPKKGKEVFYDADSVCLLSGGVDSLIGAIDLCSQERNPLFVSQIVKGSANTQEVFSDKIGGKDRLFQYSFPVKKRKKGENYEPSTRARSLVFYALAALAADAIRKGAESAVDVYVPENGFISLNIPLTPGRMGSLSTKTTHPVFIEALQSLYNALGLNINLKFPYRFKTKGEMITECLDPQKLENLIGETISCGKYGRRNKQCGVCLPCIVRRASFLHAGWSDSTKYEYSKIQDSKSDNILAVTTAYLLMEEHGLDWFTGGALNFSSKTDRENYEKVFERGLHEIVAFLRTHEAL